MNWADYVVIGLIVGFAIWGYIKGVVMSVYKVVSYFACIFASIKLYPVLAKILEKTSVYDRIRESIMKTLLLRGQEVSASSATAVTGTSGVNAVMGQLPLPEFLKKSMVEHLPSPASLIDLNGITNAIGDELAKMVLSVLSLIALFIVFRIVLAFVGLILKGISKLPVFKQVDKTGGLVLGAVQGFLILFVLCAVLMLFQTNPRFSGVFSTIDSSAFASWFYEHNFIMNWMFPPAA